LPPGSCGETARRPAPRRPQAGIPPSP